ncbi:MAG: tryptophan--tRNA ligase, partial [Synergistes sp.]|nr:tryptophan--tRNA ligase [Synergistes sp.]
RRTDKGTPEKCPVWDVHKFFNKDAGELAEIHEGCLTAGIGCVDCKKKLMAHITEMMDPIQKRRAEFAKNSDDLYQILETGASRAREVAAVTMDDVYTAMNLLH